MLQQKPGDTMEIDLDLDATSAELKATYQEIKDYVLEDRLTEHLNAVDDETQERMDILMRQMMEKQGITEELKARD